MQLHFNVPLIGFQFFFTFTVLRPNVSACIFISSTQNIFVIYTIVRYVFCRIGARLKSILLKKIIMKVHRAWLPKAKLDPISNDWNWSVQWRNVGIARSFERFHEQIRDLVFLPGWQVPRACNLLRATPKHPGTNIKQHASRSSHAVNIFSVLFSCLAIIWQRYLAKSDLCEIANDRKQ